jgi:exoribonuclease-2
MEKQDPDADGFASKLKPGCLAVYKNRPVLVSETGEKITISFANGETLKVREKDIGVLHPGPLKSLAGFEAAPAQAPGDTGGGPGGDDIRGAWELLEGSGSAVSLSELAELAFGSDSPQNAWKAWLLLAGGLYFTGTIDAISARSGETLKAEEEKRRGKAKESKEWENFLDQLKQGKLDPESGGRFMQDVEALAYGRSEKSRTMRGIGRSETPQEAHRLLLETGYWTLRTNPHPRRFGISPGPAKEAFPALPQEQRKDLTRLPAFAIDSPWSGDPDDAVSLENTEGGRTLYVHIADPAAAVSPDSGADREARDRGATLYLPEGCFRMLAEEALNRCALGLSETSPALTFKMILEPGGTVRETEIFPSIVKVKRLSYEEADALALGEAGEDPALVETMRELFRLGELNFERRMKAGGIHIELPEVHISAAPHSPIRIDPIQPRKSAEMVRECMLLAGEGAAAWASGRRLPFPYITQETGELPNKIPGGIAGGYQLRRCMRPRSVSAKPGCHWGLGLDGYTQVTSPLRRYTDLLAHQQIRAFLKQEAGQGGIPLGEEEILFRLAAGNEAAQMITQAERASNNYWTVVYLSELLKDRENAPWDAVVLEKRGGNTAVIIPGLALETQIASRKNPEPNEIIRLRLAGVRIPEGEAVFKEFVE